MVSIGYDELNNSGAFDSRGEEKGGSRFIDYVAQSAAVLARN
jgi:hypothetical protein